jgi:hypothetical protein
MQVHDKQKQDCEPAKTKPEIGTRLHPWTDEGGCPYIR